MIDFVRSRFRESAPERGRIVQFTRMQEKPLIVNSGVAVKMRNERPFEAAGASNDSVHLVALFRSNSVRYEPSCPVMPVMSARAWESERRPYAVTRTLPSR